MTSPPNLTEGQSIVGCKGNEVVTGDEEERIVSRELIAGLPGQADINDQFIPQNLPKTLTDLKKLLKAGNGNYQFGSLTAEYYGYLPGTPEYINWMEEVAL